MSLVPGLAMTSMILITTTTVWKIHLSDRSYAGPQLDDEQPRHRPEVQCATHNPTNHTMVGTNKHHQKFQIELFEFEVDNPGEKSYWIQDSKSQVFSLTPFLAKL